MLINQWDDSACLTRAGGEAGPIQVLGFSIHQFHVELRVLLESEVLGESGMPSFDIVSEVDIQEVRNAVDQANREIETRFDFKGVNAKFEQSEAEITLRAEQEFQLNQMMDILRQKLVKRKVDIKSMDVREPETSLNAARQLVIMKQGIESVTAKQIVKDIKASKIKVQAQIQGDQVRVTGKKRDELQQVISILREADYGLPLQFQNFRD
jgi:uncharacterized protein YajQ (UPF0234 family)